MKEIFAALLEQLRAGNDVMLATLAAYTGSVPRGVGTQMVLTRAGRAAGTVGGGFREKEMTRFGLSLLEGGCSGLHVCGPERERRSAGRCVQRADYGVFSIYCGG